MIGGTDLRYYLLAIFIIVLDQWTKWLVVKNMELGESITILDDILYITSHRNRGAAFGILQGEMWLFYIITAIVAGMIIYYLQKYGKYEPFLGTVLALGLGGAIGNFIDRLFRGAVVDFADVKMIEYNYPIFNVADSALVVAVILFLIKTILDGKKEKKNGTDHADSQ
jgi:signal peptidase II